MLQKNVFYCTYVAFQKLNAFILLQSNTAEKEKEAEKQAKKAFQPAFKTAADSKQKILIIFRKDPETTPSKA